MQNQTRRNDFSPRPEALTGLTLNEQGVAQQTYNYKATMAKRSRIARFPFYLGLVLLPLLVFGLAALLIANTLADSQYGGKIEPGTSISGVYVGEMTRDQAKATLQKQLVAFTTKPILLKFSDKTWQPSLEQLGVTINYDASLNKALFKGNGNGPIESSRLYKLMYPKVQNFPLELQIDDNKLKGYISDVSDRIKRDTVEPTVGIKNGQVVSTDGVEGFNIDFDNTYAAVRSNLVTLIPDKQNLLTVHNVQPVVTQQELNDFKGQLQQLLGTPIIFKFKDKTWIFDQKEIANMVKIQVSIDSKQPRHFSATVDTAQIDKFVQGLRKDINQDPKDAKIAWQNNQIVVLEPSATGQFLVVDRTADLAIKSLSSPAGRNIDLIVDQRGPSLDSNQLDKLGLKEIVGEGVSHFGGSAAERSTNIQVGAKFLNGALIKPHSTFSFLNQIGEISEKRGYVKGYAIVADQTVPDVGGGICQVATTAFRAAFYAGVPIAERNSHLYRVSWYEELGEPVGFDAAVYEPGVDFKFDNPTDYWMAISAFVKNGNLYVQVWGTKLQGQTVELIKGDVTNQKKPPPDRTELDTKLAPGTKKQIDFAHAGLDITITRVIKLNGVELKREPFFSRYQAWPNIFKVGPAPALGNAGAGN